MHFSTALKFKTDRVSFPKMFQGGFSNTSSQPQFGFQLLCDKQDTDLQQYWRPTNSHRGPFLASALVTSFYQYIYSYNLRLFPKKYKMPAPE